MDYNQAFTYLKNHGQDHLLSFWGEIDDSKKTQLLTQIENLDLELVNKLYSNIKQSTSSANSKTTISPIEYISKEDIADKDIEKYIISGSNSIKSGKLAYVTMAGGQGTRLGFSGPKGAFILDIEEDKSLFELLCDSLKEARAKYGLPIEWYIMTSSDNNDQTISFFESKNYFGYGKEHIHFFTQGSLPMLLENGKIVLEEKSKIKLGSDGHGGIFTAMHKNGIVQDMEKRNIKWIFISGVDNCLMKMVDPLLIGLCEEKGYLLASKTVVKNGPFEKVGVFCKVDGKPSVIEYTEVTEEMANLKDERGNFVYGQAHILANLFSIEILKMMENKPLEYHVANKKTDYIDEFGNLVKPDAPNAYKFEAFIFDAFSFADDMLLLETKREEEFAPVKNKEGLDSPQTALEMLKRLKSNGGK